jgi:hypothetical protein
MQEKRRILCFVFSNSTWKDGQLDPEYKVPFHFLVENNQRGKQRKNNSPTKMAFLKTGWERTIGKLGI